MKFPRHLLGPPRYYGYVNNVLERMEEVLYHTVALEEPTNDNSSRQKVAWLDTVPPGSNHTALQQ